MVRAMYVLKIETEGGARFYSGTHFPGIDNDYTFLDRKTRHESQATRFTDSQIDQNLKGIRAAGLKVERIQ